MKVLTSKFGLIGRLGMTAAALLLTQQALAAGVAPGTTVNNTATVTWSVGGNPQGPFDAVAPQFIVDRRVDFTLEPVDGTSEIVSPGDTGITFDFTLASTGNSVLDFAVTFSQLGSGDIVDGNDDNVDLTVGGSPLSTVYVDNLAIDGSTVITLTGDAAAALVNGDVANIRVTVTALDASGTSGAPVPLVNTDGSADDPTEIDNVFANPDGLGTESADDGIVVESAVLAITKSYEVISDPVNGVSPNAKPVPGAVIEYTVSIDNTAGSAGATGISITDIIDDDVLFFNAANDPVAPFAEPYAGGTANVSVGAGFCLADASAADGCTFDSVTGTLTIAGATLVGLTPINIGFGVGATLDIKFQVVVP